MTNDRRASNGGARAGAGRVGKIPEAAYRLQQLTARDKNRDALDESALAIAIGCVRAALKDLEADAVRRSSSADVPGAAVRAPRGAERMKWSSSSTTIP